MTSDMGFEDPINADSMFDRALSIPVAMSPKPDQKLVPSHGRPPQTSLEKMIAGRLRFAFDTIKKVPSLMVLENQAPWCHSYLYRTHMPREMQGKSLRLQHS